MVRFNMCACVCSVPKFVADKLLEQGLIHTGGWSGYAVDWNFSFNNVVERAVEIWGKQVAYRHGEAYIRRRSKCVSPM